MCRVGVAWGWSSWGVKSRREWIVDFVFVFVLVFVACLAVKNSLLFSTPSWISLFLLFFVELFLVALETLPVGTT